MGFSRVRRPFRFAFTVAAGQTKDIDSVLSSEFHSVKYQIRLTDVAATKNKVLVARASKKSSDVSDTVYSVLGDSLSVEVKVLEVGSDIVLRLVNNESFDVNGVALKTLL